MMTDDIVLLFFITFFIIIIDDIVQLFFITLLLLMIRVCLGCLSSSSSHVFVSSYGSNVAAVSTNSSASVFINGKQISHTSTRTCSLKLVLVDTHSGEEIANGVYNGNISLVIKGDCSHVDATHVQSLQISGNVSGEVCVVNGDVNVGGDVHKNAKSKCGDITVEGSVFGDAKTTMGDISMR